MFLVEYLNSDEQLTALLNGADRIFPLFTTDISKPSIVYEMRDYGGTVIKQYNFEIKIVWSDYDECVDIAKRLDDLLNFDDKTGMTTFNNVKFRSVSSGGGWLYRDDLNIYEFNKIYTVKVVL